MKIGLISSALPMARGGGRFIVDWLQEKLVERGHVVEIVYIPYTDELEHILPQMAAYSMIKLDHYFDKVITFRPPAHMIPHPHKVIWFIHHLRMFYDMWGTMYCSVPDDANGRALRNAIIAIDNKAFGEAEKVFTNSRVVGDRMRRFNGVDSEVLYPPVLRPEQFRSGEYGDEIVSVCRMEHHKRQHLLIEALAHTRTAVRLHLCGPTMWPPYIPELRETARRLGVDDRVTIENRWISEEEKIQRLEHALASAYMPFDEDSYGYPTIEAAHAHRCTITVADAGGVPEFVADDVTGLIAEPTAAAVAEAFDRLYADRTLARRLGEAAAARVAELGIDWDVVIEKLLT
jgi:glycosyltransferase involved in cell wall biosynthesis